MADKPIWFPFYPGDFLASSRVALMTTEEIGGYLLLLCHCWQDPTCTIPADDDAVRKLSRLTGSLEAIKSCFIQKRGRLFNERLYEEWKKVKEKSELAKKSVEIRWKNERNTNVKRTLYSSHRNIGTEEHRNRRTEEQKNNRTEEETQIRKISCDVPSAVAEFDKFWNAYPKKIGKKAASKAWHAAKDKPPLADIIDAIEHFRASQQWMKDNGQYIPNPATWLNQGRWSDQPVNVPQEETSLQKFLRRQ